MIKIKIFNNGIIVNGHSETDVIGKDLICASVSTITQGLIKYFKKDDLFYCRVNDNIPILVLFFKNKREFSEILKLIYCQLKLLETFNNKAIVINKIKKEITITKDEEMEKWIKKSFNLQLFASKKGVGSTKNGRDSNPQYLGMKLSDGQYTKAGQIIYRQRGNKIYPGLNVGQGKDDTLFAKKEGYIKYTKFGASKTKVSVMKKLVNVTNS